MCISIIYFLIEDISENVDVYIYIYMFIYLLNKDLRQRRPSYGFKSSFWPLAGMMVVVIVVRSRTYNYNYCDYDCYDFP